MNESVESVVEIMKEHFVALFMVLYYIVKAWVDFFYVPRKDLKGEIVLLTGGAGDIGKLLSVKLASKGCTIILWDINEPELIDYAAYLNEQYGNCNQKIAYYYKCDITNQNELLAISELVVEEVGHPNIVINSAAIVIGKYFMDLTFEEIKKVYEVNVLSNYQMAKIFLPNMLENNHGHIVCMASILATNGVAGVSDYCPSKAAVTIFMKSLRQEIRLMGKDNIHCTTILPHHIKASMFRGCKPVKYPVLDSLCPDYVAEKIINAIEKNQILLYIPRSMYLAVTLNSILPEKAQDVLLDLYGINEAMVTFTGRKKE